MKLLQKKLNAKIDFFIFISNDYVTANKKHKIEIINEKYFLFRWEWEKLNHMKLVKKICLYSTVNGQEKTILNDVFKDCPHNLEKSNLKIEKCTVKSALKLIIIIAGILLIGFRLPAKAMSLTFLLK